MLRIRTASKTDFGQIWEIFRTIIKKGDTYAFSPGMTRDEAFAIWFAPNVKTYVATDDEQIVGTYILRPNQPGLGSHVANAAFMVHPDFQGKGIGEIMGKHAINEARRIGYLAMQFNLVVTTNEAGIKLWNKLGFQTVGVLPKAFRHQEFGLVDAYIMYQIIGDEKEHP